MFESLKIKSQPIAIGQLWFLHESDEETEAKLGNQETFAKSRPWLVTSARGGIIYGVPVSKSEHHLKYELPVTINGEQRYILCDREERISFERFDRGRNYLVCTIPRTNMLKVISVLLAARFTNEITQNDFANIITDAYTYEQEVEAPTIESIITDSQWYNPVTIFDSMYLESEDNINSSETEEGEYEYDMQYDPQAIYENPLWRCVNNAYSIGNISVSTKSYTFEEITKHMKEINPGYSNWITTDKVKTLLENKCPEYIWFDETVTGFIPKTEVDNWVPAGREHYGPYDKSRHNYDNPKGEETLAYTVYGLSKSMCLGVRTPVDDRIAITWFLTHGVKSDKVKTEFGIDDSKVVSAIKCNNLKNPAIVDILNQIKKGDAILEPHKSLYKYLKK